MQFLKHVLWANLFHKHWIKVKQVFPAGLPQALNMLICIEAPWKRELVCIIIHHACWKVRISFSDKHLRKYGQRHVTSLWCQFSFPGVKCNKVGFVLLEVLMKINVASIKTYILWTNWIPEIVVSDISNTWAEPWLSHVWKQKLNICWTDTGSES